MAKQSLGLIETVGLAAAVEAADAALKSANVRLVGYELTKGGGMVTVKLEGEVGAVNAAISAASYAAAKVGDVYAQKVIARTADNLEALIESAETVGVAHSTVDVIDEQIVAQEIAGEAEESVDKASTIPVVNLDNQADEGDSLCNGGSLAAEPEKAPSVQPASKPGRQPGSKSTSRKDRNK